MKQNKATNIVRLTDMYAGKDISHIAYVFANIGLSRYIAKKTDEASGGHV